MIHITWEPGDVDIWRTMWLRSSYYTRPDEKRVEKYVSRGFTLVADPAIP